MFVLVPRQVGGPGWAQAERLAAGRASFTDASGRQVLYLGTQVLWPYIEVGARVLRNPVSHTLGSINSSDQLAPCCLGSALPVISRTSS